MIEATTHNERPTASGRMPLSPADVVRVARPGLIASHLWVYLLPIMHGGYAESWNFWAGLVYVTVPLGLLIYGWNDYFDGDVDRLCPRKSDPGTSAVFGLRLPPEKRAMLPQYILAAQLPFALIWAVAGHPWLVGWLALMAAGNALYNGPGLQLSRVPVLAELTATGIYMLIVWLGMLVHSPVMPAWCWLFAVLSILNLQIMGTLVDVEQDAAVGKRTLSVAFGRTTSLATVFVFLLIKTALTWRYTGDPLATAVMGLGAVLLASGFSIGRYRRSSTTYSTFIVLDWIWLGLML